MDIKSYRAFDPTATRRVTPQRIGSFLCQSLGQFIESVDLDGIAETDRLLDDLRRRLHAHGDGASPPANLPSHARRCAADHAGLFASLLSLGGGVLGIDASGWSSQEEIEFSRIPCTATGYILQYLQLIALSDHIGDTEGIEAMKRYLDWTIDRRAPAEGGPETIAALRCGSATSHGTSMTKGKMPSRRSSPNISV